jgi:predicted cation transporter
MWLQGWGVRLNAGALFVYLQEVFMEVSVILIVELSAILLLTIALPLCVRKVEQNLEVFLLVMGIAAALFSGVMNLEELGRIFSNTNLYLITTVVFVLSMAFMLLEKKIDYLAGSVLEKLPLKLAVAIVILLLGLLSSVITAIIASMLLAEIISMLPIGRKQAIRVNITACFAIGLGAVLTPIGEPLSTIVVSRLNAPFLYLFDMLAPYVIPGIVLLSVLGAFAVHDWRKDKSVSIEQVDPDKQTFKGVIFRTVKIFAFIVALELLGAGFQPFIDKFVVTLNDTALYILNLLSAILDNATLAAAEISPKMDPLQIKTILMSLLISGGMLITGNIPNIVTAGRLKIRSKDWAVFALPVGAVMMVVYYVLSFVLHV